NDLTGEWETHEIEMKPENFFLWPWGLTGGAAAPFDEVMVNYKQVGLSIISSAPDDAAFGWGPADGNATNTLPDYGGFSSVAGSDSILAIDNFGTPQPPIPTLNEWGMIIFVVLIGLITMRKMRRQEI
ncbi:MAG: IPTL-CTERM sorting domain-containing protein, partial [Deltaproteobacteria bacterium]|nr:IPTL-CTERM sorting domain-containing protein [Deltaproteobacteria bacterium]